MLEDYRKKRNFAKTPEPPGEPGTTKGPALFFCVQKHLASQVHYDFRLEHDGVLLSWAVPKGPSLDPKTRRLAMHVEDHPIEYGDFEGVIPEGYGAGIVMLWDRGTWTPEVADVDAALKKGDLKFTLDGFKLKGSWVLVRTSGRYAGARGGGSDRSWLLIKHRDEWAGDLDITEFAPKSVKSGGDFEDILGEDTPAVWQSNRPAKTGDAAAMLARIIERAAAHTAARGERADEAVQADGAGSRRARASAGRAGATEKPGVKRGTGGTARTRKAGAAGGAARARPTGKAGGGEARGRGRSRRTK